VCGKTHVARAARSCASAENLNGWGGQRGGYSAREDGRELEDAGGDEEAESAGPWFRTPAGAEPPEGLVEGGFEREGGRRGAEDRRVRGPGEDGSAL
jgi:hypothetical protein